MLFDSSANSKSAVENTEYLTAGDGGGAPACRGL